VVVELIGPLGGLAPNVALLLALALLYGVLRPWWTRAPARLQSVLAGLVFGSTAIAGMQTPFVTAPGMITDARVIPVLLAGPFGGAGAAVTAGAVAVAYRLALGGAGSIAGVGMIVTAAALGALVAWRWKDRGRAPGLLSFLLLGVALDAVVLVWAAALPDTQSARQMIRTGAVPVGLFLPFGTLLLGVLLVHEVRRHAERERLTLTQFALERTGEALLWIDADGRIVNVNPAAERLTGVSRGALLDWRVWDLDVSATPERWQRFWETVRKEGSLPAVRRYRRADGREFPVETSNEFVEHRGRAWIAVWAHDVTDRARADEERTALLAREQALRLRAEEASVLKDQFLATLSHELRTPLTSILGYTRLLRSGSVHGAGAARALEIIERNTRAQTQIVNDLLDASSIVLRKLRIEPRPLELAPLVEAEVEAARPEALSRRISLEAVVDRTVPLVSGDPARLRQIVRSLLSNALKFTPAGGTVTVRLERSGQRACLVVRDTGIGIDHAFLPHVFDRFRQADSSMTRAYAGLGVGLAIVRHLVELHDGQVSAESDGAGHGATFSVTLPLPSSDTGQAEIAVPGSGAGADRLPDLGGVRVLIVEDEPETRELVVAVLADCGAEVTAAASADQAVSEVQRVKPDVVLSDIAMPGGDGYELIQRIRSLGPERGGKTPAAALTAYAAHEDAERALAAGFEAHIAKPFEPRELARVVADLSRRRAA
jgi:PAS domain S-box-containing protein